jgi:hypothetical protein
VFLNCFPPQVAARAPLGKGEANLRNASVVNVSQILTVDKADLVDCTGQAELHGCQRDTGRTASAVRPAVGSRIGY